MTSGDDITHACVSTGPYRSLVSDLCGRLATVQGAPSSHLAEQITRSLHDPIATDVLNCSGTDVEILTTRALRALQEFSPRESATARTPVHEVQILLLQQIDLAWWSDAQEFSTDEDLAASPELVDLRTLRRRGELDFRFALASDSLLPRAYKFAIRRMVPRFAPGTPGLSSPYARPQLVDLLNDIASRFRTASNGAAPPLWINCITRTVVDQCRLQQLGFSAHYPSAHCRGWAADIEVEWYERFGMRDALVAVLEEMRERNLINAIDEGRIWHVSPSPMYVRSR